MTDTSFVKPFIDVAKILADAANAARNAYNSATKKPDESWKAVSEAHPDHPEVLRFNEYEAKVNEKIAALQAQKSEARKSTILAVTGETSTDVSEDEAKALRDEFIENRRKFRLTRDNILSLLNGDEEALNSAFTEAGIQDVGNLSGGTSKASTGEIVRLRISDAWVDGEPVSDSNGKVSLTLLAQHLKVNAEDIRTAAAKAGNVDSVKDLPKGEDVEFTLTVGDETKTVVIRPAVPGKKD